MPQQHRKYTAVVLLTNGEEMEYPDVDFVSFVSTSTFGRPEILTEEQYDPRGSIKVLYVLSNSTGTAAVHVERQVPDAE